MTIEITDAHRALARALADAVDRPGQNVDAIARKIAEDEAAGYQRHENPLIDADRRMDAAIDSLVQATNDLVVRDALPPSVRAAVMEIGAALHQKWCAETDWRKGLPEWARPK